jgi:hypothetical protein
MDNFSWEQMGVYVAAVVVINGGLFRIAGFFVKKWMTKTEKTVETTASALSAVTLQQAKDLADVSTESRKDLAAATAAIALDIKTDLREHRADDVKRSDEIKLSIDKLADHVAESNGRTGTLETKVEVQIATCKEARTGSKKRGKCK